MLKYVIKYMVMESYLTLGSKHTMQYKDDVYRILQLKCI